MYKVQFTAQAINPDNGHTESGWVDKSRPFELREESTDVAVYEFDTYDDAVDAIHRFIGDSHEEDREDHVIFYSEDTEDNYDTGETFSYSAILERD